MTTFHRDTHPRLGRLAEDYRAGKLGRREFMGLASTFGATAAFMLGVAGGTLPAVAQETPKKGGTLKVGMRLLDLRDPVLWQ